MTTNPIQQMTPTRVTADEIIERLNRGEQFTFLDTRNPKAWSESSEKLPRALRVPADELEKHLDQIPGDRTIITYCTCPNEGSSFSVAQKLMELRHKNVHPLYGGFDAWKQAGGPVEPK